MPSFGALGLGGVAAFAFGALLLIDSDVITAGRHPRCDIFLDDITVSRRHAEVRYQEGGFWVHDVGSLNGTYLNRQRIDNAALSSGDEVQVGKFRLLFLAAVPTTVAGPGAGEP